MSIFQNRFILIVFFSITIISLGTLLFSPLFLVYSERPAKCDAVMVLLGSVMKARRNFAERLQEEGYGNILLIPAYNEARDRNGKAISWRCITELREEKNPGECGYGNAPNPLGGEYPALCSHIENTHREVARARQMIESLGITSVNVVSSPYHTRRLKVICEKVFRDSGCELHFVATPLGPQPTFMWWTDRDQRWWVFNEWIKLAWFYIYSPFCRV